MKLLYLPFLTALSWLIFTSCQKEPANKALQSTVVIHFTNTADGNPLVLNKVYTNSVHEEFTLTKFKYYISNIALADANNKTVDIPDTYFLVDQSNPSSQMIEMQANAGTFTSVSFLIGVDSTRNVSGAQNGALDPANDMFWTWNTGYIMAKMEGTSPASNIVNKKIEYHIGGFKADQNAVRKVVLNFSQSYTTTANKDLHIYVNADVLKWFYAAHVMSIAATPAIMTPGTQAVQFADNYAKMFTLSSVSVQ